MSRPVETRQNVLSLHNKWANSVVALRVKTGEFAWGFQLVHHDLWDYDSASPPLLATITRKGQQVPVVIQGNKTGFLYVLNRDTGAPVFPVEERPVPQTDVPGEISSPTQPHGRGFIKGVRSRETARWRLTIFPSRRAGLGDGEMRAVRLVVRTRVDRSS
jgi:glucose dehydrogenase